MKKMLKCVKLWKESHSCSSLTVELLKMLQKSLMLAARNSLASCNICSYAVQWPCQ